MDFSTADDFSSFLAGVKALGGADTCEDVHGGMEAAINLSWSKKNRVLIHIADAPAHGIQFNGGSGDSFPTGDPRGLRMEDLIAKIKQLKIDYTFGKINNSTDAMINAFRAIGGSNFVRCSDMADVKSFPFAAVDTISATIENNFRSMAGALRPAGRGGLTAISEKSMKSLKSYRINTEEPNWRTIPERRVRIGSCFVSASGPGGKLNVRYSYKDAKIKMSADPFAEGSQRLSYFGIEVGRATHFFSHFAGSAAATVVFKTFKHVYERTSGDGREDFLNVVEGQAIANYLAAEFNKVRPSDSKEIHFLSVKLMEVSNDDGSLSYYTMEDMFPDYHVKFIKYNSNFGYVNRNDFASTLNAFSHWTYDLTNHYLMVVDLQGIQHGTNQYVLTDPAIHCKDPRFGTTNLGRVGMETFFEVHECNRVCSLMGLKPNRFMKKAEANPDLSSISTMVEKLHL